MSDRSDLAATVPHGSNRPAQGQSGESHYLVSLHPALGHREYALAERPVTIGRNADQCDVVVSGATVSRAHCRIQSPNGSDFVLTDLGSTNGVYVNRERVTGDTVLAEGALIGLGGAQPDYFRFQRQSGRGQSIPFDYPAQDAWAIGRDPDCDLSLSFDSTVSSRHATLRHRGDAVEVIDLKSTNGTWVNGRRVRKATLGPTDVLTVGSTVLRVQPQPGGGIRVLRRDSGDEIALEAVALTRRIRTGGFGSAGTKTLLDAIHLSIRPGEFVGILGPSGAGKSTLLTTLNGYHAPNHGCVLLNETPLHQSFAMFRSAIGYVPQDDIVHPELTVRRSLDYVARLRLPPDVTDEQRGDLIDSMIEALGLSHVLANRVGELSGGQRKRVSIGCELITKPGVLFLDEPTSGMDPSTEERLMRHFKAMAGRGTTILITTHILYNLDLLDRVIIVSRGRLVFFGKPAEALQFFATNGQPLERPTQIFELLEGDQRSDEVATGESDPDAIADTYQRAYAQSELFTRHVESTCSDLGRNLLREAGRDLDTGGRAATASDDATAQYRALLTPSHGQSSRGGDGQLISPRALWTLTRRQFAVKLVSLRRALFYLAVPLVLALVTLSLRTTPFPDESAMTTEKEEIAAQLRIDTPFGQAVDAGPVVKTLLSEQGADDPRLAADLVYALRHEGVPHLPVPLSVLVMAVMTALFMGALMACLDISTERPIYIRERMANQRIADYIGSKLPFLLLVTALQCALFLIICWLKPGLRSFDPAYAYLAMLMMTWTACAMGLFLSAVDPSPGRFSVILALVAVLPQLVLSGGLGPDFYRDMADALKPLANALPARWGLEMLMTAFYDHPDRVALAWVPDTVRNTIGFEFGGGVYWKNTAVLLGQAAAWLVLCGLALKRLDRRH